MHLVKKELRMRLRTFTLPLQLKKQNKKTNKTNKKQHNLPTLTFHERNKSRKKEKTDQNKSN